MTILTRRINPSHTVDMDDLLTEIAAFRQAHKMAASTFGRMAINDPDLVKALEVGNRELRRKTIERVRNFMVSYRPEKIAA